MDDDDFPYMPLLNAVDLEILMHRDAHFGGNFDVMIDYYEQSGVGTMPDFELDRMRQLKLQEDESDEDLADKFMPEPAKQTVEKAKKLYVDLRNIYEVSNTESVPKLISDLILAEEEVPLKEIDLLVKVGKDATNELINLLTSDSFYDPLFPGYGRAPIFAAKALAEIKDPKAIPFLFTAIGQDNFFTDDEIIKALMSFGEAAKEFLIKRLIAKPYSRDNENAIIALSTLEDDPDVAQIALGMLGDSETWYHEAFVSYLIFACSGLVHEHERQQFKALLDKKSIPGWLKKEIEVVINHWK